MDLITFLSLATPLVMTGIVPPAEWCVPGSGLEELSGCIKWTDLRDECQAKDSDDAFLECYCTQEYLSSLYECESDVQKCLASHTLDGIFDGKIAEWHTRCDARMTSGVTTPPLPTITQTYDLGACSRLYQSCLSADYETNLCSNKHLPQSSMSFVSCVCQPPVYSLFSECQYNGNISCKRTTAAESNILGYSVCSYFWSGSETLSSIDWTSFLDPTGAALMTSATSLAPVDVWITQARRPNPSATPTRMPPPTAPPTGRAVYLDSTVQEPLRQIEML